MTETKEVLGNPEVIREDFDRPFEQLSGEEASKLIHKYHDSSEDMEINGSKIITNDLIPENETGNPIVFVSGLYTQGDTLRQMMYDAYLSGRRVLTYNTYHGVNITDAEQKYGDKLAQLRQWDPDADVEPQLHKALALIGMLQEKKISGADVFAHSEGAIVATIASFLEPTLFKKQAWMSPSGMIGDTTEKELMSRKKSDDLEVVRQRAVTNVNHIRTVTRDKISGVIPGCLKKGPQKGLLYRQISPKYGNSPEQDLSYKQRKEVGRNVLHSIGAMAKYPLVIGREYTRDVQKPRLQAEFTAVTNRKLHKWLKHMDTSNITIAGGEKDAIYPWKDVLNHANQAGIDSTYVLQHATHNVHHYQPHIASHYIFKSLGITPPKNEQSDSVTPTS